MKLNLISFNSDNFFLEYVEVKISLYLSFLRHFECIAISKWVWDKTLDAIWCILRFQNDVQCILQ